MKAPQLAPWIALAAVVAATAAVFAWQLDRERLGDEIDAGTGETGAEAVETASETASAETASAETASAETASAETVTDETVADPAGAAPVGEPVVASLEATLAMVLAPDAPERVRVLAEQRSFGDRFVLAAVDHGAPPAGEERDEDEEGDEEGACDEEEGNDDAYCDCVFRAEASPDRGWRAALGRPVVRIELARIATRPAGQIVEARVTLTGPVIDDPAADLDEPPELRVRDLDGDGRAEVTAIFAVELPDCDTFQADTGTLGVLLEGGDLHVQAAFARSHLSEGGDSDVHSATEETVWRLADENGDGHEDLLVRRTAHWSETEAEGEPRAGRASATWSCPYDLTSDRWACPSDHADAWLATVVAAASIP